MRRCPAERGLHLPAAQPGGRRPGRALARHLLRHLLRHRADQPLRPDTPTQPIPFPTSPSWGYRVTQGLHVITGTAAVPLLLVKLWTVYPQALRPAAARACAGCCCTVLERGSIAVLVAAAIFQLATGLANSAQWYPWAFSFRATHYAIAWIAIGALRRAHRGQAADHPRRPGRRRRGRRRTTGPTATDARRPDPAAACCAPPGWPPGSPCSPPPAAPCRCCATCRSSASAPATARPGIPINKSARRRRGHRRRRPAPATASTVAYGDREVVADPRRSCAAMPQRTADLPIACVEGWSASGDLDRRPGPRPARPGRGARRQRRRGDVAPGARARSGPRPCRGNFADDDRTLLALELDGEPLALDHGYPCRLIAPEPPGRAADQVGHPAGGVA